jgi:hypothetical protein
MSEKDAVAKLKELWEEDANLYTEWEWNFLDDLMTDLEEKEEEIVFTEAQEEKIHELYKKYIDKDPYPTGPKN